ASPFSMRCRVTRDRRAASAAETALTRKALRRLRKAWPSCCSERAESGVRGGLGAGIVFLIMFISSEMSTMRYISRHPRCLRPPEDMLRYRTLPVTPFQQNCSIVWCDRTMKGAVIDPGGELDRIVEAARVL